jgi:hypothetical protein
LWPKVTAVNDKNVNLVGYRKVATIVVFATVISLVFGSAMRSWTPLYDDVYAQTQSPTTSNPQTSW